MTKVVKRKKAYQCQRSVRLPQQPLTSQQPDPKQLKWTIVMAKKEGIWMMRMKERRDSSVEDGLIEAEIEAAEGVASVGIVGASETEVGSGEGTEAGSEVGLEGAIEAASVEGTEAASEAGLEEGTEAASGIEGDLEAAEADLEAEIGAASEVVVAVSTLETNKWVLP